MKLTILEIRAITLAAAEHYKLTDFAQNNLHTFLGALDQAGAYNPTPLEVNLDGQQPRGMVAPEFDAAVTVKPALTLEEIAEQKLLKWVIFFHQHEEDTTGTGRYPTTYDEIVWEKDNNDQWIEVPGESWSALSMAIRRGGRNFTHLKGGSLRKFMESKDLVSKSYNPMGKTRRSVQRKSCAEAIKTTP